MRFVRCSSWFTFVLLVLLALPAAATTAVEMSTRDLATESDVIVIGNVTAIASRWADERNLVTDVTIAVSEVLKGEVGETITVTLPGGSDSNRRFPIAMSYPAAPQLHDGENAFLFLVAQDEGLSIAGWSQGKYSIVSDDAEQYVSRDLTQLRLSTGAGVVKGGTASRVSLKAFRRDVEAALSGN